MPSIIYLPLNIYLAVHYSFIYIIIYKIKSLYPELRDFSSY